SDNSASHHQIVSSSFLRISIEIFFLLPPQSKQFSIRANSSLLFGVIFGNLLIRTPPFFFNRFFYICLSNLLHLLLNPPISSITTMQTLHCIRKSGYVYRYQT